MQGRGRVVTKRKFEKGEKYRPVVTVTKVKGSIPTVVEMSGRRYVLEHKDQYKGGIAGDTSRR